MNMDPIQSNTRSGFELNIEIRSTMTSTDTTVWQVSHWKIFDLFEIL